MTVAEMKSAEKKQAKLWCAACREQIVNERLVDHWRDTHPQSYLEYVQGKVNKARQAKAV